MQAKKHKIIEAKNISKFYYSNGCDDSKFIALENINLDVYKNEILCISGGSGAGKSTLLNILSGLSAPSEGLVYVTGKKLPYDNDEKMANIRKKKFGFIFQFYNLLAEFTVLENIMIPMMLSNDGNIDKINSKATDLLENLGLKDKAQSYPIHLSGGEKQRVAIARALSNDPEIIFADEPTGNLDEKNSENIYEILERIWREKSATIIMVSHDKNIKFSDYKTAKLEKGHLLI